MSRRSTSSTARGMALGGLVLIGIDVPLLERAAALEPARLRSLDAIHLAIADALGDELAAFVVYDARLAEAAPGAGFPVTAPGSAG
jgi:predicted nucleic acid-binding protein